MLGVIFYFRITFTAQKYYFKICLPVIDRFLVFYVNIRYNLWFTSTKLINFDCQHCYDISYNYYYLLGIDCDTEMSYAVAHYGINDWFLITDVTYIFVMVEI